MRLDLNGCFDEMDATTTPNFEEHGEFLKNVIEAMFKIIFGMKKDSKVIEWIEPEKLKQIIDLKINKEPGTHEELLTNIQDALKYSVKTGHPYFLNQLFSGLDPFGLAGQWVTDVLNPSIYTYEVAPVFTLQEQVVLQEFCRLVGYSSQAEGLFCPGGSISNGTAINLARYRHNPEIKKNGTWNLPKMVVFTSDEAHYSVQKMSALLGIGEANVIDVKTDEVGRMDPGDLEEKIHQEMTLGHIPLIVVATLGTTVRGAFDPVVPISEICQKYDIWLHLDAAWGGGLIFSKRYRYLLNGIEKSDSITINPHKLLAVPQQCSILLVRNGRILKQCHSKEAQYLFQKDKFYDTNYDCGDRYFQCGRKCDVFKFWMMWKAKGSDGFGKHVDTIMENSIYLTECVKRRNDFKLVSKPEYINVCFWYVPSCLRKFEQNGEYGKKLHMVAPRIKEIMVKEGRMMINYQPLKKFPNFFRFVSQNSTLTKLDIDFILNYLSECGQKITL